MSFLSTPYKIKIREALRLALPIIAGQLGQVLMGFFDTVQIGALNNPAYIAGSGFANNLYWMINLLGVGVLFSVSTLVSESFGEKHPWKAIGVYRSAIKVALVLTVLFTVVMLVVMHNIEIFREKEIVNQLAMRFLRIVIFSSVFLFIYTAGKQLLDGMGRTKVGMVVTMGGLALNVLLNWLLICGHWGFPRLEIEGAAIATSVSRALMAVVFLVIIWRDKRIKALRREFKARISAKSYVPKILSIGIPSGLQLFWEVAAFGAAQIMSGWLDVENQAAFQIALNLASVTFMVITGISVAGNILTGFHYGAKDVAGIKLAGKAVFLVTITGEVVFAVLFLVFHSLLPGLYTTDAKVISIASAALIFAAGFQLSDGLQSVAAGVLRGIQDVRVPSAIALCTYWGVMVPACYLLTFKAGMGQMGIWIGFIIGLSIAATALLLRFRWKTNNIRFTEV